MDRQCPSCGGFCEADCERENVKGEHEYVLDCPRCGHCCPERKWVGLTDEEKHQLNDALNLQGRFPIIETIEAKLKEKNNG